MIKHTLRFGFTEVRVIGRLLIITHAGNMGNTIESVNSNLKQLGLPTIAKLKDFCTIVEEAGTPDYSYSIVLHIDFEVKQLEQLLIINRLDSEWSDWSGKPIKP